MTWSIGDEAGGDAAATGASRRAVVQDCLFLTTVVLLSCLPYVAGLGLYSDDWAFLATLHGARDSYLDLLPAVMAMELATRPVQAMVLAGLYALFGLEPLGYHVLNSLTLAAGAVLFYLSLRILGVHRAVAIVVPLIYALLPHYSTDRFWIAAFQANACVFLYFVSLYSDLRFVNSAAARAWLWKALGTVALVGSILAYEVTAVLLLLNVALLLHILWVRNERTIQDRRALLPRAVAIAANVAFVAAAIGYKFTTTVRADVAAGYRYRALRILTEAAPVHFGEYGLALPLQVGRALRDYFDLPVAAVSVLIGIVVATYLWRRVRPVAPVFDGRVNWLTVVIIGVITFGAGYGVALMTWEIGFHMTGPNNRTAMGAAIGVAWVFAGVVGKLSSMLPSDRLRWAAFAGLIALLATSGSLLVGTIGRFWIGADRQQQVVIDRLQQRFAVLPPGSVVLLDGLCPFHGPAPTFATNWDTSGMLRIVYGDGSLQGDVVKPNTEVTATGVRTILFDDVINVYPYSDRLVVYHLGRDEVVTLSGFDAARDYFDNVSAAARPACPPYTDGDGAPIFGRQAVRTGP